MTPILFAALLAAPTAEARPAPQALRPDRSAQRGFDLKLPRAGEQGPAKPDAEGWRCPVPTQRDGEAGVEIATACRDFLELEPDVYRVSIIAQLDNASGELGPEISTQIWVQDGDVVLTLQDGRRIDNQGGITDWFKLLFLFERHGFTDYVSSMDPMLGYPDKVDVLLPDGQSKMRHSIHIHPINRD